MKYINLLSFNMELICLFPNAKILEINFADGSMTNLKIETNNEVVDINHFMDTGIWTKIQNSENFENIDSMYLNPIQDLTIVCDRKLWYELYYPMMRNNFEAFLKLEKLYVEKNVTVFFNFAILEAVNYEVEDEFLYDFKFNHIKITDYELFKDKKNFYYDSFYALYHLLAEGQLNLLLNPHLYYGWNQYLINFENIFENFNIVNKIDRRYLYNHTCLKPRYHRIKFMIEAAKSGIITYGRNNVNVKFLDEYKEFTSEGFIFTDNGKKFSSNHLKYFNKDLFDDFKKIEHKLNITPDDKDFLYDHLKNYFKDREYNEAYIEIVGETHCIFDLEYGFFTEKSLKPIMSQNFCMIYGSNKVYDEFKRIGINLFLDDLGISGIEDKNELEQIDIIVNSLKKMNKKNILKLYMKHFDSLKKNKKILYNYYCKIINDVNVLLLKDKKNEIKFL